MLTFHNMYHIHKRYTNDTKSIHRQAHIFGGRLKIVNIDVCYKVVLYFMSKIVSACNNE